MSFVIKIYKVSIPFPKEEIFVLTSQLWRSTVSIPSNISEGYGREGLNDYLCFLNITIASLFEL